MRHLLICPEYPPAQGGGIGTYARNIAHLLADRGETVHVIAAMAEGAERSREVEKGGRLTIHRVPYLDWRARRPRRPHSHLPPTARRLHASGYHPQAFAWQAALVAERLVEGEGIDVIEAQEYEAPAYFLQLRRALLAPVERQPPIVIHLHSPSDLIYRHNDYPVGHPALVAERFESYSMRAADALLSPSRFLAAQMAERLGRAAESIEVIGYPIGAIAPLHREASVWSAGRVCYVGRLEGRKGVLEWLDAAVAAVRRGARCSFDFVGENVLGDGTLPGRAIVERRIPPDLASRFRFHGPRPRDEVAAFLSRASLAVVPSRWDNFPNTCIEAMSSGLPVLTTREGGMAELVEDGVSGWLADTPDEASLTRALLRALDTPAEALARMGAAAVDRIRSECDNDRVLDRQLAFRQRLVETGASTSSRIAFRGSPVSGPDRDDPWLGASPDRSGIALVVSEAAGARPGDPGQPTLASLRSQSVPPAAVVLVGDRWPEGSLDGWPHGTEVLGVPGGGDLATRCNRGVEAVANAGVRPAAFCFLEVGETIEPDLSRRALEVLSRCPEIGLLSFWTRQEPGSERYRMRPPPELPHQWLRNDVAPPSVVRTEALSATGPFRAALRGTFASWDLANAILVAGWAATTLPEVLATHACREETEPAYPASLRMRQLLLERFEAEVAADARALVELTTLDPRLRLGEGSMSQRERFDVSVMLLERSMGLIRWLRRVLTERLSG